ncbi:hypothetical protein JCM16303_006537 [Sporobolomyces ruberrimus]
MSTSKSLLRPLSKSVYYLAPSSPSTPSPTPLSTSTRDDPSLLVVFGWMDAQLKHMDKYLSSYRKLFPTSPILLLQSSQAGFYSSKNSLETRKAFEPAIEMIRKEQRSLHQRSKESERGQQGQGKGILVHVFSNGGCMSLKWLNQELAERRTRGTSTPSGGPTPTRTNAEVHTTNEKTPLLSTSSNDSFPLDGTRSIIFDSCPGKSSLLVTMRAFSAPIRSKLLKIPTMGFLALLHGFISFYNFILRKPPILNRLYSYLNLPTTLPRVPRLYIYSKPDELIPYKDVEAHGRTAREELGVEVRMEEFVGTSHVGHLRGDPERYWKCVEEVWRKSLK